MSSKCFCSGFNPCVAPILENLPALPSKYVHSRWLGAEGSVPRGMLLKTCGGHGWRSFGDSLDSIVGGFEMQTDLTLISSISRVCRYSILARHFTRQEHKFESPASESPKSIGPQGRGYFSPLGTAMVNPLVVVGPTEGVFQRAMTFPGLASSVGCWESDSFPVCRNSMPNPRLTSSGLLKSNFFAGPA